MTKTIFFAILIGILMIMVLVSLVRGIIAFLAGAKQNLADADAGRDPSAGPTESQLMQSKMMFARIKYQALAVVVIAILLAVSK
jgi:Hypoxia induced protein conserved region